MNLSNHRVGLGGDDGGDALDFWRVLVADKAAKRLLLFAEMRLPGECPRLACQHQAGSQPTSLADSYRYAWAERAKICG